MEYIGNNIMINCIIQGNDRFFCKISTKIVATLDNRRGLVDEKMQFGHFFNRNQNKMRQKGT